MKRTKADAEQTRSEIMDAAERLFLRCGVPAASLDKIAAEAGVTRGAVYWHFKDKADLLVALRRRYCMPQQELLNAVEQTDYPDPFGLLARNGQEILRMFEADEGRQRLFVILSRQMPGSPEAEAIRVLNAEVFTLISQLMEQARKQGKLSARFTPDEAATFIFVSMNGVLGEWLSSGRSFALGELGGRYLCEQLRMLSSDPEDLDKFCDRNRKNSAD